MTEAIKKEIGMSKIIKERIEQIRQGIMPERYKETKVGIIPEDWSVHKLKNIVFVNKKTINKDNKSYYYYDLSSVDKGLIRKPDKKIGYDNLPSRARRVFGKGDVLVSTVRPYLKGFAHIDFDVVDSVCSTGFAVLSERKTFSIEYIYHYLFSNVIENRMNRLTVGSNYPAINNNDINNLLFGMPLYNEQQKIADILSTWDRAIELKESLIKEKQEQKKELQEGLLTGEIRLGNFKEKRMEINLKDVAELSIGLVTSMTPNYVECGTPLIRNSDISEGKVKQGLINLNPNFSKKHKNRMFKKGDIVTVHTGEVGVSAVIEEELVGALGFATLNTRIIVSDLDPYYVCYYFNTTEYKRFAMRMSTGDGRNNFNLGDFQKSKIPFVSIEAQRKIVSILFTIDKEIELLKQELEQLKEQKKGLMQLLLTGIVRVGEVD